MPTNNKDNYQKTIAQLQSELKDKSEYKKPTAAEYSDFIQTGRWWTKRPKETTSKE